MLEIELIRDSITPYAGQMALSSPTRSGGFCRGSCESVGNKEEGGMRVIVGSRLIAVCQSFMLGTNEIGGGSRNKL